MKFDITFGNSLEQGHTPELYYILALRLSDKLYIGQLSSTRFKNSSTRVLYHCSDLQDNSSLFQTYSIVNPATKHVMRSTVLLLRRLQIVAGSVPSVAQSSWSSSPARKDPDLTMPM